MSSNLKKFGIFLGLLCAFTLYQMSSRALNFSITDFVKEQAIKNGIAIELEHAAYSFPARITLERVGLLIPTPQLPIPLYFDEGIVEARLGKLFLLTTDLSTYFNAYNGKGRATLKKGIFGATLQTDAELEHLDLAKHPLATTLGIRGILDAKLNGSGVLHTPEQLRPEVGTVEISLSDGSYFGGHRLAGVILLPEIREVSAHATATLDRQTITITNATLNSSLGNAMASGTIDVDTQMQPITMNIKIDLHLTEEGRQKVGGYLALAARTDTENPSLSWNIIIRKKRTSQPVATVRPS